MARNTAWLTAESRRGHGDGNGLVLDRSSGEDDAVGRADGLAALGNGGLGVADAVALVQDAVVPGTIHDHALRADTDAVHGKNEQTQKAGSDTKVEFESRQMVGDQRNDVGPGGLKLKIELMRVLESLVFEKNVRTSETSTGHCSSRTNLFWKQTSLSASHTHTHIHAFYKFAKKCE